MHLTVPPKCGPKNIVSNGTGDMLFLQLSLLLPLCQDFAFFGGLQRVAYVVQMKFNLFFKKAFVPECTHVHYIAAGIFQHFCPIEVQR